ncbi:hypothetical protein [Pseudogracilibacillus sp. SO30301A]|uniref:hypothetical protein n=1 Tax=Pseudogracilibacillus sp. SO30301A TaxID=3098291 RepID=UPI00300E02A9
MKKVFVFVLVLALFVSMLPLNSSAATNVSIENEDVQNVYGDYDDTEVGIMINPDPTGNVTKIRACINLYK